MNHEAILAVLPDSKDDALSLKEIARALGLEMNSYVDWIRIERRLASSLRALARWGWVASDRGRMKMGIGFGIMLIGRRSRLRGDEGWGMM